jgi:hypothetical protein
MLRLLARDIAYYVFRMAYGIWRMNRKIRNTESTKDVIRNKINTQVTRIFSKSRGKAIPNLTGFPPNY